MLFWIKDGVLNTFHDTPFYQFCVYSRILEIHAFAEFQFLSIFVILYFTSIAADNSLHVHVFLNAHNPPSSVLNQIQIAYTERIMVR